MIDALAIRFGLPPAAIIALAVLIALQLTLQVFALVDLARRGSVAGGRKWIWALVIIAGNLVGAVLYLAVGRAIPRPAPEDGSRRSADATRRALDELYGSERPPKDDM